MVESLHTWLKISSKISGWYFVFEQSYINEPKQCLTQFNAKKEIAKFIYDFPGKKR